MKKKENNGLYFDEHTEPGFYGVPQQITDKIKEHEISTKEAIDDFKDTMHTDVTEQTEQQKEDAAEGRRTFTNVFGAFTKIFKNIFTKDKGDISGETFYEMVQRENDETQAYMSAHTEQQKFDMNELIRAIKANTSGDTVNVNHLIQTLTANTQTIKSSVDGVKSTNQTGFGNVTTAINNRPII